MSNYTELVKALRNCAEMSGSCSKCRYKHTDPCKWTMMHDAATAIEALQDELEELKEQLNDAEIAADDNGRQVEALQAEIRESMQKCAECSKWNEPLQVGKAGNKFTLNSTKQPLWVSVEDELPEPTTAREWYLVALESGTVMTNAFEKDRGDWWALASPVKYWMPLPEPPQEVQDATN